MLIYKLFHFSKILNIFFLGRFIYLQIIKGECQLLYNDLKFVIKIDLKCEMLFLKICFYKGVKIKFESYEFWFFYLYSKFTIFL